MTAVGHRLDAEQYRASPVRGTEHAIDHVGRLFDVARVGREACVDVMTQMPKRVAGFAYVHLADAGRRQRRRERRLGEALAT